MSAPAPDFLHQADMGFTHREYLGALPAAVAPFRIERESALVYRLRPQSQAARQCVRLTLQPQRSRAIAALAVPVTSVKLEFFDFDAAGFDDFMRRYRRHMHKGGG